MIYRNVPFSALCRLQVKIRNSVDTLMEDRKRSAVVLPRSACATFGLLAEATSMPGPCVVLPKEKPWRGSWSVRGGWWVGVWGGGFKDQPSCVVDSLLPPSGKRW